jgi:hypothetical protein
MPDRDATARVSVIEAIIPRPPADVAPMRKAFTRMVSKQWQTYVPLALRGWEPGIAGSQFAKGRFIGEMYARACYSMLLVSHNGPKSLRVPVRASALLPQSRGLTIRLGSVLVMGIEQLLPRAVHRQLLLTSALMGMLDVVLDNAASSGEAAALRIASLTAQPYAAKLLQAEQVIVALARAARQTETAWQAEYWERVLQPAVRNYCQAEVLAIEQAPDPTGMGHRWAGIGAAIKGMWYVAGPMMGLQGDPSRFERTQWNREQHWMADTSLLMQMIDDWVDQDEDRGARLTPVVTGDWTLESAAALFDKTVRDTTVLLDASGIQKPILKAILVDLYKDYLHTALDAMRTGVAA